MLADASAESITLVVQAALGYRFSTLINKDRTNAKRVVLTSAMSI